MSELFNREGMTLSLQESWKFITGGDVHLDDFKRKINRVCSNALINGEDTNNHQLYRNTANILLECKKEDIM